MRCKFQIEGICDPSAQLEKHHIKPRRLNGTNKRTNIAMICSACHVFVHRDEARAFRNGWLRHHEEGEMQPAGKVLHGEPKTYKELMNHSRTFRNRS